MGDSCRLPLDYYRNNVAGTVNLLEVHTSVNNRSFLFPSLFTYSSVSTGNEEPSSQEDGLFFVGYGLWPTAISAH